uniref:DUF559 domain-containing protein n=1 Tax=viral metagenome TaxID=1070528 RepID=A0A6C0HSS9_9ZZZZ
MTVKNTKEEFIEKAKKKHGDKYDYSKVDYSNIDKKVIIICPFHDYFEQIPYSHLKGHGCKKCGKETTSEKNKSNTFDFIEKAKKIHGDKYDYSKVDYINTDTKVIIICKIHGEFVQRPYSHVNQNCGCKKCGIEITTKNSKSNTFEFIEKAKKIHGYKYDYSMVQYNSAIEKITIICKNHGEFKQCPSEHLSKKGCILCGICSNSNLNRSNTEEFIEKAKKIHGNIYDYSKVNYISNRTKVTILCYNHGEFEQLPKQHLQNHGCINCVNKTEGMLFEKIKNHYPTIISQFIQDWCKNKRFDFCIPEYKIIIELDGVQHFKQVQNWKSPEEQLQNDKFKEKCANENQYSTIRILQEDVYNNSYNWCEELCDAIEYVKECNKIQNIYLCKNGEYDNYYT